MTEKIEAFWVNATAFEVARVMNGETVEARFRDDEGGKWLESDHSLGGYDSTEEFCKWISSTGCPWRFCQVYREPSWFTDKPDPGPGWRLLGKFPDEELKPGDELWFREDELWGVSNNAHHGMTQGPACWYRRRIEAVEPEPKHYVLRVGDSYETPCGNWGTVMPQGSTQRFLNVKAGDTIETTHGQTITITEKGFEVTQ
jgi:hypothetical protein